MKFRTKIAIYNLVIIIISGLLLGGIFISVIYNLSEELTSKNRLIVEEELIQIKNNIDLSNDFNENSLKKYLNNIEYEYLIVPEKEFYEKEAFNYLNNIKETVKETTELSNKAFIVKVDEISLLIKKVDDNNILIVSENLKQNLEKTTSININKFIILMLIANIVIIIIASVASRKIVKKVMKPIDYLSDGTNRVKEGNLEEPVVYKNNDEFKNIIDNFNDMQEALLRQKEKEQKFEQAKREMINGLSHDIRTPLTSIKGYIKGIKDGVANTEEKKFNYLNIAYDKTLDLEFLLNKLFEAFDHKTDEMELEIEKINIKNYLNSYLEKHKLDIAEKEINVKLNSPSNKMYINADVKQLERVFNNLFENSYKYSGSKNIVVKIDVWQDDDNIYISYNDNGKGIKKENINNVMKEFWREDSSRNTVKGNGLGLYIVKKIIEAHNGTVEVKNKRGFYIEFTFKEVEDE